MACTVFKGQKYRAYGNRPFKRFITKMTIQLYGNSKFREAIPLHMEFFYFIL